MCPTVTFSPTIVGRSSAQWMTQLSCTLEPWPITIALLSPRSTAPNQIEAPASTVTSPIRTAVGAMNASSATCGVLPVEFDHRRHRASLHRLLVLVGADQQALREPLGDHPALEVHAGRQPQQPLGRGVGLRRALERERDPRPRRVQQRVVGDHLGDQPDRGRPPRRRAPRRRAARRGRAPRPISFTSRVTPPWLGMIPSRPSR